MNGTVYTNEVDSLSVSDSSEKVVINFTGDLCFGTDFGKHNRYMDTFTEKGGGYFFEGVKDVISKDDLTVVNLENVFTHQKDSVSGKIYTYKAPAGYVNILKDSSIEAVSIVNNHMQDYKQDGFDESLRYLNNLKIGYFGYSNSYDKTSELGGVDVDKTYIYQKGAIKVGFVGYLAFNSVCVTDEKIKSDIEALKEQEVDYIVVYTHWGGQNDRTVNAKQQQMGHKFIDYGADLVIGNHPHVLQEREYYKGKLIYYSLGNFMFACSCRKINDLTAIVHLELTKDSYGSVSATFKNIPVSSFGGMTNTQQPKVLSGRVDKQKVYDILNHYR
jgi:poly-gamma-glutamate synthesis protein (capsule biosynthesis protein)